MECKISQINSGKPSYDLVIDDKAYGYNNKWTNKLLKIIKEKIMIKIKYIILTHLHKILKKERKRK